MPESPLTAEDRLAVIDLIARYSRLLDAADVEGWLEIWRPDAVLEHIGGRATGRGELRAWMQELFETRKVGATPALLVHFVGLPVIDGAGDRCRAETYTLIVDYSDERDLRMPMLGRYVDECVRVDDRWWIARRQIFGDLVGGHRA